MSEPVTTLIEVTINLCNWENNLPEVFSDDYCDYDAIIKETLDKARKIASQPFKFTKEEKDRMTKAILENWNS